MPHPFFLPSTADILQNNGNLSEILFLIEIAISFNILALLSRLPPYSSFLLLAIGERKL